MKGKTNFVSQERAWKPDLKRRSKRKISSSLSLSSLPMPVINRDYANKLNVWSSSCAVTPSPNSLTFSADEENTTNNDETAEGDVSLSRLLLTSVTSTMEQIGEMNRTLNNVVKKIDEMEKPSPRKFPCSDASPPSNYERLREAKILRNEQKLKALGLYKYDPASPYSLAKKESKLAVGKRQTEVDVNHDSSSSSTSTSEEQELGIVSIGEFCKDVEFLPNKKRFDATKRDIAVGKICKGAMFVPIKERIEIPEQNTYNTSHQINNVHVGEFCEDIEILFSKEQVAATENETIIGEFCKDVEFAPVGKSVKMPMQKAHNSSQPSIHSEHQCKWNALEDESTTPSKNYTNALCKKHNDEKWNEMFQELLLYKEKNENTSFSKTLCPKLWNWMDRQRSTHATFRRGKGTMEESRITKLKAIGFKWYAECEKWRDTKLKEVNETKKHHVTSTRYTTDPPLALGQSDKFKKKWDEMFHQLLLYKERSGHTSVSRMTHPKLGNWVHSQRTLYSRFRRGKFDMDRSRIMRLESTGFHWNSSCKKVLKKQVRERGNTTEHCPLPTRHALNPPLGQCAQNVNPRKPKIPHACPKLCNGIDYTAERKDTALSNNTEHDGDKSQKGSAIIVEKTDITLGMGKQNATWAKMFEQLVLYKKQHGNTLLHSDYHENPQLGCWVNTQRELHKAWKDGNTPSKITKARMQKLESICFEFECKSSSIKSERRNFVSSPSFCCEEEASEEMENTSVSNNCLLTKKNCEGKHFMNDENFNSHFEVLKQHHAKYGNYLVSRMDTENVKLANWVAKVRTLKKDKLLSTSQVCKLDSIKFVWCARRGTLPTNKNAGVSNKNETSSQHCRDKKWACMFKKLKIYIEQHGNCMVPRKYEANQSLASWVNTQRRDYESMCESRVRQLNLINFAWTIGKGHLKKKNPEIGKKVPNGGYVREETMRMRSRKDEKTLSYLAWWANNRIRQRRYDITDTKAEKPTNEFQDGETTYTLACSKMMDSKGKGSFGQKKTIRLTYLATKYPDEIDWDIQKELEAIANFRSLTPGKAVARLEHFQTSCNRQHLWDHLTASDFEQIVEDSHLGCGFIPEDMLCSLLKNKLLSKRVVAIQVRVFAPSMGIFKGMLVRKHGINKIQLPASMWKVGPSRVNKERGIVMIAKGVFPTQGNRYLGNYLSPELSDPPKSFEASHIRCLSKMYVRIWKGFGVPGRDIDRYVEMAKKRNGLHHANLIGVCDPTGKLPEGHIFVTGNDKCPRTSKAKLFVKGRNKLFVSRSPCVDPSDAHVLPVVNSKPKIMPKNDWEYLCSFPFGLVIFATPKNGKSVPLPVLVGEGDLDGDSYFVCWDDKILSHFNKEDVQHTMKRNNCYDESKSSGCLDNKENRGASSIIGSSNWLEAAQNEMLAISRLDAMGRLIGKTYTECCKYADIYHEDARAFSRAYKDALDSQKHGGKVYLPSHLHENIPPVLREFVHSEI